MSNSINSHIKHPYIKHRFNVYFTYKIYIIYTLFVTLLLFTSSSLASDSFYQDRMRGWFWFEENNENDVKKSEKELDAITPEVAKKQIQDFKSKLEDLNALWLINPTIENTKNLMQLEAQMFQRVEKASLMRQLVTLEYPNLNDNLTNPSNVQAIRMNKLSKEMSNKDTIKNFAKEFNLVLFSQGKCNACIEFEPILKVFADVHGFNVEAVSDSKSKYFKTMSNDILIKRLNVRGTPSVFVVHKKMPIFFELVANYVSLSEMEDRVLLASEYVKNVVKSNINNKG